MSGVHPVCVGYWFKTLVLFVISVKSFLILKITDLTSELFSCSAINSYKPIYSVQPTKAISCVWFRVMTCTSSHANFVSMPYIWMMEYNFLNKCMLDSDITTKQGGGGGRHKLRSSCIVSWCYWSLKYSLDFCRTPPPKRPTKKSWYHVGYLGNHNTRGTALPSRPLLSGRAVFLPQKASSPFLLVHVQLLWLFSCAPFTFPASTGPIEGLTLCEQDVPQASVAVDTAVRFPKEARSSKFSLWSQEIAVLF